jgi:hypothetical protein
LKYLKRANRTEKIIAVALLPLSFLIYIIAIWLKDTKTQTVQKQLWRILTMGEIAIEI